MEGNTTALIVMTDGREEYLKQSVSSAMTMLTGNIVERWMHDDTGDETYRDRLRAQYPTFSHIGDGPRKGFGGAISHAWKNLKIGSKADFIFHLEDDFVFNREIPLDGMAKVLNENPNVYQMALRRQAWNSEEIKAGGVIERWPDRFHQEDGWILHRMWLTTNPSLYRRSLIERSYPVEEEAEGHFGGQLFSEDPLATCGYWGQKTDDPWVEHIGVKRNGSVY